MLIDWETVLPTATDPKLMDGGETEMAAAVPGGGWFGCPDGFAAPARPAQPEIDIVDNQKTQGEEARSASPCHQFPGRLHVEHAPRSLGILRLTVKPANDRVRHYRYNCAPTNVAGTTVPRCK